MINHNYYQPYYELLLSTITNPSRTTSYINEDSSSHTWGSRQHRIGSQGLRCHRACQIRLPLGHRHIAAGWLVSCLFGWLAGLHGLIVCLSERTCSLHFMISLAMMIYRYTQIFIYSIYFISLCILGVFHGNIPSWKEMMVTAWNCTLELDSQSLTHPSLFPELHSQCWWNKVD